MLILPTNHVLAHPHVDDWIAQVSRSETDAIGFLCHEARQRHHRKGLIWTCEEDGDLVAFCVRSPLQKSGTVQIHQSFTIDPARRLDHQRALVTRIAELALLQGAHTLILKCADDLAANLFWTAVGFEPYDQTKGGRRRGRIINHFRLPLPLSRIETKTVAQDRV
jgi:hypothetical protein